MPEAAPLGELAVTEPSWPDVRRHRCGRLTVDVGRHGFRNLALNGRVVVQEIYPAVRAPDWTTVEMPETHGWVQDHPRPWQVTLRQDLPGRFHSTTRLRMLGQDTVLVSYRLESSTTESVNRWGLNVCLNAQAWSGCVATINGETYVLPVEIGPQRLVAGQLQALFPSSDTLEVDHPWEGRLRIASSGRRLEVEDQRNWTDPTYKIYSGPLADPRPVILAGGSTVQQELRLTWDPVPTRGRPMPASSPPDPSPPRELPRIGVQLNEVRLASPLDQAAVLADLAELAVDHVRIDAERPMVRPVLEKLASVEVELAVLASGQGGVHERAEALTHGLDGPGATRILWHLDRRRTTGAGDSVVVRSALGSRAARVAVVPGTDAYFTDLNRDRPDVGGTVSFSISPTVHTRDSETVFASLAAQAEVVRQARAMFGARVLVSPVTFGIRGAPETCHDAAHRAAVAPVDPRLNTLEGAAWTLGSIHALVIGEAASGTWHELFGEAGLVAGQGPGRVVRPAFHAIAALKANSRPQVQAMNSADAAWVALHLLDRGQVVVASLRPWPQMVRTPLLDRPLLRRRLREQDVAAASRTRTWWPTAPVEVLSGGAALHVDSFEVSLIDLDPAR